MSETFRFVEGKEIEPEEYARLMASVGWGREEEYDSEQIKRSIEAYPYICQIRDEENALVGYVSAFSDGAFSTFIGEMVIQPQCQGKGLGKMLIEAVERQFAGVPVYANPLASNKGFFIRQGYSEPIKPMAVVSKRNQT